MFSVHTYQLQTEMISILFEIQFCIKIYILRAVKENITAMKNLSKTTVFVFTVLILFSFQSCLQVDDPYDRTEEMEMEELTSTIQKLEAAGYDIDTTALGVFYVIHENGTGPTPQEGDTCYIEYATYTINSVLLDTSHDHFTDGIWEMIYKKEPIISGFNDAVALLNKGAVGDFIIPSKLAYGAIGNLGIEPYSPLIFSIKLHDLKVKTTETE